MGGRQAEPSRFAVLRLLLSFTIRAISSNSVPEGNNVFKSDGTVASKIKDSRCCSRDAGRQGCTYFGDWRSRRFSGRGLKKIALARWRTDKETGISA